ncbi:MAG: hypothetical protein RL204_175 [Bacteroidota bacterium]|jgi:hypothetical protein
MKRLVLLFILSCISITFFAQSNKYDKSKEIGLLAGTAYYLGEVNPYKHFGTQLKTCGGLSFRNNFNKRWTLKTSVLFGQVYAYDSDSDSEWIRNRNLHFRNQFIETSMQFELNYFSYQIGSHDWISPYLFMGLAYTNMKPQANYKGNWYELQPLGTEGQGTSLGGDKYNTNIFAMPLGVGIKFNIYAIFGFSMEWGVRRTFTDYFDDISGKYADPEILQDENGTTASVLADQSLTKARADGSNTGLQRGDPGRKDLYFFALGSLNIRIDKKATSCWNGELYTP